MNSEVLIQVKNLFRYYGSTCAVRDVSFSLNKGEVLGFLGLNGAGKSTAMQLITGNLAPDAGDIGIAGHNLLEQPRQAKAIIGYLPEHPPVYRELSVDEYLTYCARLHRLTRRTATKAVENAKSRCGLGSVSRRLLGNLSKGYQQRVGIAQAIIHSPSVVVLDEPTAGLDPVQNGEIRELIKELGRDHAVVLSTHILSEVEATCSHVQIIHAGRLVYTASLGDVNQRQNASSVVIRCDTPPSTKALTALPGISRVEQMDAGRFCLHHAPSSDPVPKLVEHAVREQWGLRELAPERKSLEQVFVDLTIGQRAMEAA